MTPPTDPYGWPEHARFDCVAEDETKHTVIVRKEPQQYARTLSGIRPVDGGHIACFLTNGTPLNATGLEPTEFTVFDTNEVLRKI